MVKTLTIVFAMIPFVRNHNDSILEIIYHDYSFSKVNYGFSKVNYGIIKENLELLNY